MTPAVQFEFLGILQIETHPFKNEQCDVFGSTHLIGMQLCIDEDPDINGLRAGMATLRGRPQDFKLFTT